VSYEKRGELDAALTEYKEAAKKLPLANLYMGNVYYQQKNFAEAEKSYKKAIAKAHSAQACNNLAWLYYTTDARLDVAEQLSAQAVQMSPDSDQFRDTLDRIREKRAR
jgi:tetratricopeptide (TPR) repeat protein